MSKLTPFLLLSLIGCSAANGAREAEPADCGGARWDDIRRGVVVCESRGDRCAFSERGELTPIASPDARWVCACGDTIAIYWCNAVPQQQVASLAVPEAEACSIGDEPGYVVEGDSAPADCPAMKTVKGGPARWCCPLVAP